ncbi:MAG TPA: amidase [Spirochaetia bacterium]|nr:amidase [Spirochaetales bacterium]HRY80176.1 amidase [Spirochaetia bacterium]
MNLFRPLDAEGDARAFRSGARDPADRIREVCDRIDRSEPEVRALLPEPGRRERLLAEARALAARYPDPSERPPLYGLLVGVKDIFNAEGFETRAGSRLPPDELGGPESEALKALKAAGALVLGKTVTTEFAFFAPGPTRNPRDLGRTPGGSSSGSAAGAAAGFFHLALGTQTIGSISRPAAYCGVAGWKPSYGRVSAAGVFPFSPSVDHIGLLAPDARALALGAAAVCGGWKGLPASASRPVLAVPEGPYLDQAGLEARERFERTVADLAGAGWKVLRLPALRDIGEINARHRRIAAAEMDRTHARLFPKYEALYAPATRDLILEGRKVSDTELAADREGRTALRRVLEEDLAAAGADLWISPSAPGPAPEGLGSTGSPALNLPWTHAGLPTLSLPAGTFLNGLPAGLQIAAPFGRDEDLLRFGIELEPYLNSDS